MSSTMMAMLLAGLMMILGFIALLSSKIYVSDDTHSPTEFEVPILGKLKTNYPALVFAIVGFALAAYAMNTEQLDQWKISGRLLPPADASGPIDWKSGHIELTPVLQRAFLDDFGRFDVYVNLKHGINFEDYIQTIDYSNGPVSVQIDTSRALESFEQHANDSFLEQRTSNTRTYKPVSVKRWQ